MLGAVRQAMRPVIRKLRQRGRSLMLRVHDGKFLAHLYLPGTTPALAQCCMNHDVDYKIT